MIILYSNFLYYKLKCSNKYKINIFKFKENFSVKKSKTFYYLISYPSLNFNNK